MLMLALKFRSWLLLIPTLKRRWISWFDGPQSSWILPVAGVANAPSVSLRTRPRLRLVNRFRRRQAQRALVADRGGPPFMMIIAPPPSIAGPGVAVLKLIVAPTLRVFCRDAASPTTSTTLLNDGSGRTPRIG